MLEPRRRRLGPGKLGPGKLADLCIEWANPLCNLAMIFRFFGDTATFHLEPHKVESCDAKNLMQTFNRLTENLGNLILLLFTYNYDDDKPESELATRDLS